MDSHPEQPRELPAGRYGNSERDANHRAAVHCRSLELVRRFEMRVEPAIGIDAGIHQQTEIVAVREYPVDELPGKCTGFFQALRIPEQVLPVLGDRNVGVHTGAIHAHDRLGQEACSQPHFRRNLAADQLVNLDLIGGRHHLRVAVVDLELRGSDLRVVLFVLEAHGPLHFGGRVDKQAERIARQ